MAGRFPRMGFFARTRVFSPVGGPLPQAQQFPQRALDRQYGRKKTASEFDPAREPKTTRWERARSCRPRLRFPVIRVRAAPGREATVVRSGAGSFSAGGGRTV